MTKTQQPFAVRVLAWWDEHGRKDLPWQHPRTPYRVWISEIMLQQTQVSTVIPYFERWMESFPDVRTLAAAPLDDALSHWAGLGYYARARNLHKAARLCVSHFGGDLPATAEELCTLPGIGLSSANAIVSQASDRPAAVLDGNVRRVLSRHAAIEGWTGRSAVKKKLWAVAESLLPDDRGADYTQAIMDLGATVCTRSKPGCGHCPIRADCTALEHGRVAELPSPKPRIRVGERTIHMLVVRDTEDRVLLERRPPNGVWGGLWSLPEGDSPESVAAALGFGGDHIRALPAFEHRLSHLKLTIRPSLLVTDGPGRVQSDDQRDWFGPKALASLGMPRPIAGLLETLNHGANK
ncbi:MAG: A/G-specific adenine glycosylase [Lysobacterales bacterium]